MLRALFGRHKTASTWARSIMHEAAYALDLRVETIHVAEQWSGYDSLGDKMRAEKPDILVMSNARMADVETLPELRAVNVVRDPRDVIVSGYFSHLHSHPEVVGGIPWPELTEHRKILRSSDKEAGLLAEIEFSSFFLDPIAEWDYQQPGVLELKMEDLVADPHRYWDAILRHWQMIDENAGAGAMAAVRWNVAARRETPKVLAYPRRVLPRAPLRRLPAAYVPFALQRFSFERLAAGRARGQEDVTSHYRRGVAGDWRNHFTDKHLAAFRDRYGDLVERLGYEW